MKRMLPIFTSFLVCLLFSSIIIQAQQTTPFIFEITSPVQYQWTNEDVGETVDYGAEITQTITGQLAWAEAGGADPIVSQEACTPVQNDLTGKIALVRRGICNFSLKSYHAQEAGAIAVIICNNDPAGGLVGMLGGDSAAAVVIPTIFLTYTDCHTIIAPLMDQGPVDAQFRVQNFYNAQGMLSYHTPQNHILPLDSIGVTIANRESTPANNIVVSAVITKPGGSEVTLSKTMNIPPDTEINVRFDSYTPDELGEYTIVYSSSLYPQDIIESKFVITEHTFALDNGVLNAGIGPSEEQFINLGLNYHMGSVYFTGSDGDLATHTSFAIANPEVMGGETFIAVLFDMNPGDDPNYVVGNPLDYNGYNAIATATYTYTGTEASHELIILELESLTGSAVSLKPNHIYMITVQYEGLTTGNIVPPRFSHGGVNPYWAVNSIVYMDRLYVGGWASGNNAAIRLHTDGFITSIDEVDLLDKSAFEIYPNPVKDILHLKLNFDKETNFEARIFDLNGKLLHFASYEQGVDQVFEINLNDLSAGNYFLNIRTNEGFRTVHFQVVR